MKKNHLKSKVKSKGEVIAKVEKKFFIIKEKVRKENTIKNFKVILILCVYTRYIKKE